MTTTAQHNRPQFTLTALRPLPDCVLHLHWADGWSQDVNLAPIIAGHSVLHPLHDPAIFASARITDAGRSVQWHDDDMLELAADNLRARAIEQSGGYSHEMIWQWMHRNALNLPQAAHALGLSPRTLAHYRSGAKTIPRTVGLACLGWEAQQHQHLQRKVA